MPSLLNKVNFTKGWPNPSIVEEVLMPDTVANVLLPIEAGFVGRRKLTTPDKWVLGITELWHEPFIFRNDWDDPDAARAAHAADYLQVPYGGIQGISFQNPLEIETIQYNGTPAVGDLLYAPAVAGEGVVAGKLTIAVKANGDVQVPEAIILAVVTKAPYWVGEHNYIRISPTPRYVAPAS